MEVEKIYQDARGKWHIEYSKANLIALTLRVYTGEIIIGLFIVLPVILILQLVSAKSLCEEHNIVLSSNSNVRQESICNDLSN